MQISRNSLFVLAMTVKDYSLSLDVIIILSLNLNMRYLFWVLQGSKASLLDDIIDHIKYLQLQIKVRASDVTGLAYPNK